MPIIELQRRLAEVGRIRLGQVIESRSGKKRPAALDTFRLTSSDRTRITEAAQLYGGKVTQWDAPSGIPSWEVITTSDKLPVVVPPSAMAFSQYYELWAAGGCQRRCDGVKEMIGEQPCLCDPEHRECEIHTRLSVMLRDLSGLGVWRVDTTGWYAALELGGSVEVIKMAAGIGMMLPATLRLDQRTIKREGEGTKRFVVPVLDLDITPAQLLMGTVSVAPGERPALGARPEPSAPLTPVPPAARRLSIAEQVAASQDLPSRRRATPIPATGIRPRAEVPVQPPVQPPPAEPAPEDRSEELRELAAADERAELIAAIGTGEETQDPPRMITTRMLTKLGVLLTNRGFDKSAEGREARLEFCRAAIGELLPDSPYSGRVLTTMKMLTFDEGAALIEMLEEDETRTGGVHGVNNQQSGEPPNGDQAGDGTAQPVDEDSTDADQMSLNL